MIIRIALEDIKPQTDFVTLQTICGKSIISAQSSYTHFVSESQ